MDELDRDLANGLLGVDQANDALSGNLAGAYRDDAARDVISQGGLMNTWLYSDRPRVTGRRDPVQPTGRMIPLPTVAGAAALALAVLILVLLAV